MIAAAPRNPLIALFALTAAGGIVAPVVRSLIRATVVATARRAGLHREGNALLNIAFTPRSSRHACSPPSRPG